MSRIPQESDTGYILTSEVGSLERKKEKLILKLINVRKEQFYQHLRMKGLPVPRGTMH
jgi:hypothetical protein